MLFAAMHESGYGTNRTNEVGLAMSVIRIGPEVTGRGSTDAIDPDIDRQLTLNWRSRFQLYQGLV
jgi:hypothetical protein